MEISNRDEGEAAKVKREIAPTEPTSFVLSSPSLPFSVLPVSSLPPRRDVEKTHLWVFDLRTRGIIREPEHLSRRRGSHSTTRETQLWLVQHLPQDLLLSFSCCYKGDPVGVVDDWVGEGDPLGWRFGTVLDEGDPTILLGEQSVSREERTGVSVRSHSEEDEVEDGVPSCIPLSEGGDQLTLVLVRELFRVREERDVDGVNLSGGDGGFREEEFVDGGEVGILVVQRDETFVAEEDFPRGGEKRRQI